MARMHYGQEKDLSSSLSSKSKRGLMTSAHMFKTLGMYPNAQVVNYDISHFQAFSVKK